MALTLDIWWPPLATHEPSAGPRRLVLDTPRLVVGRGESCDIRLPDPSVSRRHASIRQRGAEYLLVDEGSTNGTILDSPAGMAGVKLPPQTPRILRAGDRIRLGRVWLLVGFDASAWPTSASAAREIALEHVMSVLAAEGEDLRPIVRVTDGPDAGRSWRLDPDRSYVVGRSDVDVRLTDEHVARRHLEIRRQGDAVLVRDLGAREDSSLGERALDEREVAWRPSTPLRLGDTVLSIRFEALEALAEIERSPDEKMRPEDQPVFPGPASDRFDEAAARSVIDAPADVSSATEHAPIEPAAIARRAEKRDDGRWRLADFLVVFLALGVLTVSGAGIVYLMRSWS
jgi:pSer/pThr/pTyr-binding forkhead associated (FHA) protein